MEKDASNTNEMEISVKIKFGEPAENPNAAARLAVKTIYQAIVARVAMGGGFMPDNDEGSLDTILVESGDIKLIYDVAEDFVDRDKLPPSIKCMAALLCDLDSIEWLIAGSPRFDSQ
ncbi:MAG TPA: hypothetical protein VKA60_20995 [Blastocatellia bacterium]|nr:hypothetical protein [Blastocatellia bacterium]